MIREELPDPGGRLAIRGLRIGVPEAFFFERLDPEVESAVRAAAVERAETLGATIRIVRLPDMAALNAIGQVIQLSEVAAVLEPHLGNRAQFGADVLALVDQGRLLPATDYINAQRLRRQHQLEFRGSGKRWIA
jgi:aspartyl-tRNA(Asn)/glutamyl-tRNA(Gln) amidotransferase subunit A